MEELIKKRIKYWKENIKDAIENKDKYLLHRATGIITELEHLLKSITPKE